jgi:hypothetical protein
VVKRMGTQGPAIARLERAGNRKTLPVRRHVTKVREGVREAVGPARRLRGSHKSSQAISGVLRSSRSV